MARNYAAYLSAYDLVERLPGDKRMSRWDDQDDGGSAFLRENWHENTLGSIHSLGQFFQTLLIWPSKSQDFDMTCTYRSDWRMIRYFYFSIKQIDLPFWITFGKNLDKQTLEVWWHSTLNVAGQLQKPCFWHPNKRNKERVFLWIVFCMVWPYMYICDHMWWYVKLYQKIGIAL